MFASLWSAATNAAASTPTIPEQTGPCKVCCDLDFHHLHRTIGGNPSGPFRLGFDLHQLIETAERRRCLSCRVILRGLQQIKVVPENTAYLDVNLVFRCFIKENQPLRLRIYVPGNTDSVGEHDYYTAKGRAQTWEAIGFAVEIPRNPLSRDTISTVKGWIDDCQNAHPRCRSVKSGILPWRVLNVNPAHDIKVEETFGDKTGEYVALSHCWGSHRPLITTIDTLGSRKTSIAWTSLPRTFQDAIEVTRALGLHYLWIDSLCIVQDDEEDWAIEAMRMGAIFEGSYVTLSATSAADSTEGCLAPRAQQSNFAKMDASTVSGLRTIICVRPFRGVAAHSWLATPEPTAEQNLAYPILSRGWCFQERLLASRVIHYTKEEIVFECKSRCRCECGGADSLSFKAFYVPLTEHRADSDIEHIQNAVTNLKLHRTASDMAHISSEISSLHNSVYSKTQGLDKQRWRMLIQHYSTRNFSYQKDVLSALSALARRYRGANTNVYLAGLWKSHLPMDLLWYSEKPTESYRPTQLAPRERRINGTMPLSRSRTFPDEIYTAPTFSWASRVGPISFIQAYETSQFVVEVLETYTKPRTRDSYGELEEGFLKLKGPVKRYYPKRSDKSLFASLFTHRENTSLQHAVRLDTADAASIARKNRLLLLCLVRDQPSGLYRPLNVAIAMVLVSCLDDGSENRYRRIGLLEWCDAEVFEGVAEEEVIVV